MNYKIITYALFDEQIKRLAKKYKTIRADFKKLMDEVAKNPSLGTDLGGGFRKIRMPISDKNKGKSAGARVITLTIIVSIDETNIGFFFIYDKSERSNVTTKDLQTIRKRYGI